jgi:hypothetical protein
MEVLTAATMKCLSFRIYIYVCVCVCVCDLFYDAVSGSDYIASNDTMIHIMTIRRCVKKRL